jgi:hypothetical protein
LDQFLPSILHFFSILIYQIRDLVYNVLAIGNPNRSGDKRPIIIKDEQGRDASHAVFLGELAAYPVHHIETNYTRLSLEISLYPINDGFGQEARASSVAKELDYDRLPSAQQCIELVRRFEACSLGSQEDKRADNEQQNCDK